MDKKYNIPIWPSDFCVVGNQMWLFHGTVNALMRYDLDTGKLAYIGSVEDENMIERILYSKVFHYDEKIILIPEAAKKVAIYDLKKMRFSYFSLKGSKGRVRFGEAWQCGEYIYCFPTFSSAPVIKLNAGSNMIEREIPLPDATRGKYEPAFIGGICEISKEMLGGVISYTNLYVILDAKTDEIQVFECGDEDNKNHSISSDGKYIYLHALSEPVVYKIEINTRKVTKKFHTPDEIYCITGYHHNKIFLDLMGKRETYMLDIENGNVTEIFRDFNVRKRNLFNYWCEDGIYHTFGADAFYFNRYNNFLYVEHNGIKTCQKLRLTYDDEKKISDKIRQGTLGVYTENTGVNVEDFIKYITL